MGRTGFRVRGDGRDALTRRPERHEYRGATLEPPPSMTIRETLKQAAQAALARLGPAGLAARRAGARDLILAYHNVVPDPSHAGADRSLHITRDRFAAHLDLLVEAAEVVPLERILSGAREQRRRPLRVALTFDDAYAGALEYGLGELAARGLPATVFVAPGRLGGEGFWWDRFADLSDNPGRRDEVLTGQAGVEARVTRALGALGWESVDPPALARSGTLAALDAAVASGLVTLGAHSWSHPNLAALSGENLAGELERPLAWLRDRYPTPSRSWVAYPYGLHSPAVEAAAARSGYESGLRVSGGFVATGGSAYAVPRMNVPAGLTANGLRLRLSGLVSPAA
ncbi:MAG: polysaccharide deacetylase family protein [Longimicrobiales bacterium]|nr:polysaccharide deacetylase family protein [Longimicrobiales bacterium]